jgi:hypothetical protein
MWIDGRFAAADIRPSVAGRRLHERETSDTIALDRRTGQQANRRGPAIIMPHAQCQVHLVPAHWAARKSKEVTSLATAPARMGRLRSDPEQAARSRILNTPRITASSASPRVEPRCNHERDGTRRIGCVSKLRPATPVGGAPICIAPLRTQRCNVESRQPWVQERG